MEVQSPYHIYLDYHGYLIEDRSYRVMPAPLMGTRFATGRQAYSTLDFWQVGAMTDFTHGINQKFLVDPSACFLSVGVNCSKPGEITLERDLSTITLPADPGKVTARYRAADAIYLGTSTGKILKSVDGDTFTEDCDTGTGQIYCFYEIAEAGGDNKLFATKGPLKTWEYDGAWKEAQAPISGKITFANGSDQVIIPADSLSGELTFVNGSDQVSGNVDTKFSTELWIGCEIKLTADDVFVEVKSIESDTALTLTANYSEAGGTGASELSTELTKFITEVWIGCKIMLVADGTWVEVKSIESDSALTLTADYSDTGGTGEAKLAVENLYFTMVESDYGFGIFDDGIRRSMDGLTWIPIPTDPLWELPSSEGIALNAVSIPRGFLIGSKRGLWIFIGGSSGINLWLFPDYVSSNNFKGMEKWGHYGIFSVDDQGIFYTDGVQVFPTNLNYLNEGFVFESCKSIVTSGWDILALVTDGTDWYLARCNLNYTQVPKYWWLVKKLSKEPSALASFSDTKALIFYEDETCEVYNKISGPYQKSGYLISSLIDENLIRLQKFYRSVSAILEPFPADTSLKLGIRHDAASVFAEKSFTGANQREAEFDLRNPTVENRLQIKVTLETTDTAETPNVTDLCWTYILERPENSGVKKNFYFTLIGEDQLEKLTGDVEEVGREEPRTRTDIINALWTTRQKKELLNYIGVDNKREIGLLVEYTGAGDTCLITIDRTNYEIKITVDGSLDQTIDYEDKTILEISDVIDALGDYSSEVHQDQEDSRTAHDLEPIKDLQLKGEAYIYVGSDVHSVIFNPQSPGQVKFAIDGRGSDRLNMSLREI